VCCLKRPSWGDDDAFFCIQPRLWKVPQMAESISEGTLKSWSKQVGDTVAVDEEVATIETDKVLFSFYQ
jgi:hypothetical protein